MFYFCLFHLFTYFGHQVKYSIREQTSSDDWKYFAIDEDTGEITTSIEFDWEDKDYYLIEVKATDGEQSHEGLFHVNFFFIIFFFIYYFLCNQSFGEIKILKYTSSDYEWSRKIHFLSCLKRYFRMGLFLSHFSVSFGVWRPASRFLA